MVLFHTTASSEKKVPSASRTTKWGVAADSKIPVPSPVRNCKNANHFKKKKKKCRHISGNNGKSMIRLFINPVQDRSKNVNSMVTKQKRQQDIDKLKTTKRLAQ